MAPSNPSSLAPNSPRRKVVWGASSGIVGFYAFCVSPSALFVGCAGARGLQFAPLVLVACETLGGTTSLSPKAQRHPLLARHAASERSIPVSL